MVDCVDYATWIGYQFEQSNEYDRSDPYSWLDCPSCNNFPVYENDDTGEIVVCSECGGSGEIAVLDDTEESIIVSFECYKAECIDQAMRYAVAMNRDQLDELSAVFKRLNDVINHHRKDIGYYR